MNEDNPEIDHSTTKNTIPREPPDPETHEIVGAQSPDSHTAAFLVVPKGTEDLNGTPGYVINRSQDKIHPVGNIISLLKQGYWKECESDDRELAFLLSRTSFSPHPDAE